MQHLCVANIPLWPCCSSFAPASKSRSREGWSGRMGGCWVLDPLQYIKTDPCCLIFNAQGHHFHSSGPAPFEDKTSFPAPGSPSSPLSCRTEQHPACPKSDAYCHSPFSPLCSSLLDLLFFFSKQSHQAVTSGAP